MRATSRVETLRWTDGRLEMIDQRILPDIVKYERFTSAAEVADGIRSMVVRGAPAIGCAAAFGVALEAAALCSESPSAFASGLKAGISLLRASRPTAVNLDWALDRMNRVWQSESDDAPGGVATRLLMEAQTILKEDIAANVAMGDFGAALLPDKARVLTHCNAGALATGGYGTALGVIRSAVSSGKQIDVVATETRPFLQGARLTAWELAEDGIAVTLIVDSAAAFLMSRGKLDAVIVGADRVAKNGDVANKIGTYGLAVVAARHGIPFYVAAPVSTFDRELASGSDIPIEERGGEEVRGHNGRRWSLLNVDVSNPVFDVTPAELVTAIITERGVIRSPDQNTIDTMLNSPSDAGAFAV